MKVIKEGSKKLRLLKINDDSISSVPSDKNEGDDSDDGDLNVYEPRVCYDKNDGIYTEAVIFVNKRLVRLMDVTVEQWLDLIYGDHKKVDVKVKEGVISKWLVRSYKKKLYEYMEIKKQWVTCGIDANIKYDPSDVEFAEWLALKFYNHMMMDRIKTDIFDFETPICKTFNKSNYLLKIDTDLLTSDIAIFKKYDEFKNEWIHEWNKGITWVPEKPWSENGIPIDDIQNICEPLRFKNRKAKWPTCNSNKDGFCNRGEIPRMVRVGYMTYFKIMNEYWWRMNDHECSSFTNYRNHIHRTYTDIDANYDPYLCVSRTFNHDARRNDEAIHEDRELNDDHGIDNFDYDLVRDNAPYHANKEDEYEEDRFEAIQYLFGPEEKYIAIKEYKPDDCTRTKEDVCHAYQEIFHIMDEGWFVTRAE
nr:SGNH hydrolase-type esterase domain-containing protein [Tanacetum cinerariifolium]